MESLDKAIADVRALNHRLKEGALFLACYGGNNSAADFFRSLEHFGFAREDVLVLSLTPDGDDTLIGSFVTRSGRIYGFDVDLDDHRYSRITEHLPDPHPRGTAKSRSRGYSERIIEALLPEAFPPRAP